MTSYDYITFDPVGFYPNNYHSRVITFKNLHEYIFLIEILAEVEIFLRENYNGRNRRKLIKIYKITSYFEYFLNNWK